MNNLAHFQKTGRLVQGDEIFVPAFSRAITITRLSGTLEVPTAGDDLIIRVQAVTGPSAASFIQQTIPVGAFTGTAGTGSLAVAAGTNVIIRMQSVVPDANDAPSYLSGYFEFSLAGGVGLSLGLCSLDQLKSFSDIDVVTWDADLELIIAGVSRAIGDYCQRNLGYYEHSSGIYGDLRERLSCNSSTCYLRLRDWPIVSVVEVRNAGVLVPAADYTVLPERGMLYFPAGVPRGTEHLVVEYSSGYGFTSALPIPQSLTLAALNQARYQWRLHKDGGNRLGVTTISEPGGGSKGLIVSEWAPTVLAALASYRRIIA